MFHAAHTRVKVKKGQASCVAWQKCSHFIKTSSPFVKSISLLLLALSLFYACLFVLIFMCAAANADNDILYGKICTISASEQDILGNIIYAYYIQIYVVCITLRAAEKLWLWENEVN